MSHVKFPHLKYSATTSHRWAEVESWCIINIGPYTESWYKEFPDLATMVEGPLIYRYWFRTKEQATLFSLRWA